MIEEASDNEIHLEWMIQNGQVDDRALTRALVLAYYSSLVLMMRMVFENEELAASITHQVICAAVGKRHRYTGEVPLSTWLFALAYRLCRRSAGLSRLKAVDPRLILNFRYTHSLSLPEIGVVMGLSLRRAASLLENARQRLLEKHQPLEVNDLGTGHIQFITLARQARDGFLSEPGQAQLKDHLVGCEACRGAADKMAAQDELLARLLSTSPPGQYPGDNLEEILNKIDSMVIEKNKRRWISLTAKEYFLPLSVILVVAYLFWAGGILKPERGRSAIAPQTRIVYKRITITPRVNAATAVSAARADDLSPSVTPTPSLVFLSSKGDGLSLENISEDTLPLIGSAGWNGSGPISLALVLQYLGQRDSYQDIAKSLMPNPMDENVMAYELENYIQSHTRLKIISRIGGDIQTLRKLLRAGFPVIVEVGQELSDEVGWIGCYQVVTGYEHVQGIMNLKVKSGCVGSRSVTEEQFEREWRAFNYGFLVVYDKENETRILNILGPLAGEEDSAQIAADRASLEVYRTEGVDRFFAWFNRAASLVELDDFSGAARDFDEAFALYESLPSTNRPWRMLWYQTRPYWAYYYTGRYQDLIDLATRTISSTKEPLLEESFYWRGLAREALGDKQGAVADLREAVEINPHFSLGLAQLNRLAE